MKSQTVHPAVSECLDSC